MSHGWRIAVGFFASTAFAAVLGLRSGQMVQAEDKIPPTVLPTAPVAPMNPDTVNPGAVNPETPSPETAVPPEKYKLAFKFRPNQIVHQEVSHEFQLTTNKNQDSETVRNSSKSKRHYRVAAVDNKTGIADLEMTIDWVHMLASFDKNDGSTTEPIEFQSDDPHKHPKKFDQILASIGKRAWLRFSPTGAPVKAPPGDTAWGEVAAWGEVGSQETYVFRRGELGRRGRHTRSISLSASRAAGGHRRNLEGTIRRPRHGWRTEPGQDSPATHVQAGPSQERPRPSSSAGPLFSPPSRTPRSQPSSSSGKAQVKSNSTLSRE